MAAGKDSAPSAHDELFRILLRVSDAKAVIETAVLVMEAGDIPPEVVTARHGVKLLSAAYDELDAAIGCPAEVVSGNGRAQKD